MESKPVAKIYVSSTFTDLQEYRERVYRVLRQLGHDVIAMEDYVATDERPVQKCLADIGRCDLYVGIFAWRYGYVPQQNNPRKKSITELELAHARSMGIPTLVFLHHEKEPWPVCHMDSGDGLAHIRSLREELCREFTVSFFSDRENLAALVSAAVTTTWEKQRFQPPSVINDRALLRSRAHALAMQTVREIGKKYISHLYIERDIDRSVMDFLNQPNGSLLLVIDRAGNGKTNLLCHICETVGESCVPYLIRAKLSSNLSRDFDVLFHRACGASWKDFASKRKKNLGNTLILVDGINEYAALQCAGSDLTRLLDDILPLGAKLIVTCRDLFWETINEGLAERFREHAFRGVLRHPLGNFTTDGTARAVAQYFEEFRINGVLQERALEECRFPLLLRFFCHAYEGRSVGPVHDIRLKALFDQYIKRKTQAISGDLRGFSRSNIVAVICDLAVCLYDSTGHQITYGELAKKQGLCGRLAHDTQLYTRILDEGIIIETDSTPSRGAVVSFVYDEFMEYLCARHFLDSAAFTAASQDELRHWLVNLLCANYNRLRFSHMTEYMMAISRDDYHRPIWREMFEAGPEWHPPIVQALSKIPSEDLEQTELTLLLEISHYEGRGTSADARRMARKSLSERYPYYEENERTRIWKEVQKQWGDEQQATFIASNFEWLDAAKWELMLMIAKNPLALGHEELMKCLMKVPPPGTNETVSRREVIGTLRRSVIPSVRRWAETVQQ